MTKQPNESPSKVKCGKVKLDADGRAAVRRDKHRGGLTIDQIAEKHNLSRTTVSNILNFRGIYRE